jgi:amidohydrolase
VTAIFGLHGWPGLKVGSVATKAGALLATTDNFSVQFIGKGCHAAFPHTGRDPIVAAAEATLNLQQFVSREIDPTESALITIASFHAGSAYNIIPDIATIEGTARTLGSPIRQQIAQSMRRRCAGIATACDCQLKFTWHEGYPATINDPVMADHVAKTARNLLGSARFIPVARPVMGGEDFAYYLEKIPGCFFFVGVEPLDAKAYPSLHSDHYNFNDDAMETGMRMFVELVRKYTPENNL